MEEDSSEFFDDDSALTITERDRRKLQVAWRHSLATVISYIRGHNEAKQEEEVDLAEALRCSIPDEHWRQGFVIINYDNSDNSYLCRAEP
jgi:hypothetical protein